MKTTYKEFLNEIYNKPAKLGEYYKQFYKYSFNNVLLAMMQLGNPEPLNTFKGWQKLGRNVKKGQKAIALVMPVKITDKETEEEKTIFIEKRHWFGLSQTEGEEVAFDNGNLEFNLNKAIQALGVTKIDYHGNGNSQGYAKPNLKQIAINPLAKYPFKTTIHELAHCLLHSEESEHGENMDRSIKEFEAEGCAYMVCAALNKIEGLEYSRGYIASWLTAEEAKEENFKRAFIAANKILKAGV